MIRSGKLKVPDWVDIVKTGRHKELAPVDDDWFYVRCAAAARQVGTNKRVGVGALKKIYGGRKRRGVAGCKYVRGSGAVNRRALQALEAIKWVEKDPNGGRRLTPQGRRDMDRIAAQVKRAYKKLQNLETFQLSQGV